MKALITTLLAAFSLNACAVPPPAPPPDGGNTSGLTLSEKQQTNLRTLLGLQPSSPFTVKVEDSDNNRQLNEGDIAITIGGIANAEVSRRVLSASDVTAIISGNGNPMAEAARQLQVAESKWRQTPHEHYRYTLQRSCFCAPEYIKPIQIRVFRNQVQQATVMPDGTPLPADRKDSALTIDDLFRQIHEAIDSKVARLDVAYDPVRGFPTSISIDRDLMMADEEVSYTASDFRIASGLKPMQQK